MADTTFANDDSKAAQAWGSPENVFQGDPSLSPQPEMTPRPHTVIENDLSDARQLEVEEDRKSHEARSVTNRSNDNLKKLNDVQYEASDDSMSNTPKEFVAGAYVKAIDK